LDNTNDTRQVSVTNAPALLPPRWHIWVAAALPIIFLLPFLDKAFHIDDTVYVYVAQHILNHPINFFGFTMNWTGSELPVFAFNKNPPALSYYLAGFGAIFGWSEMVMHSAQLILTVFASIGIFRLAQRMCSNPLLAVFVVVLTPSFLVSTSVIMCEPLMLACYVWAMVFWLKASESADP
jgi:4-amino-4-deoxy-L-arabinose transferase-like glycosyltransferase